MINEENIFNDSLQNNLLSRKIGLARNSIRIPQKQQIEIQDGDSGSSLKKLCLEKNKPIEHILLLSLEDILRGTTEHVKITRNVLDSNGSVREEDKNFNVKVKAGMAIGNRITFPGEGDQSKGNAPGDVVFIVKDKVHSRFKLINQVDIEYTAQISIEESKSGCELAIPTLENDPILLSIEEEITEDMIEKISGRGLFYANNAKKRGCLIIRFEICEHKPIERLTTEENDDHVDSPERDNEPSNKETQSKLNQKNSQQEQPRPSGTTRKEQSLPQDPPVEHDLMLTLEQISKGCKKKLKINRIVMEPDGESETFEDKVVVIEVKPGADEGTRFTFAREGDHNPGTIPADVVFIARDKPHDIFKRYGPHIEYTASITQKQFLDGVKINIPTLEKEHLEFSLGELSKPSAVKRFYRRGLPYANDANKRGDLIVRLDVNKNADIDDNWEVTSAISETFQDPPIENDLFVSLEQIANGCTKKMKIEKMIVDSNGNENIEDKILQVKLEPGTEFGSKITFPRESDQRPGIIPADIIFIIKEKAHSVFKRKGLDIEYTVQVNEKNCKDGTKIQIPTLEKDKITLTLNETMARNNVVQIEKRGLPHQSDISKRGNLIIRLNVIKDTSNGETNQDIVEINRQNSTEDGQVVGQQSQQTAPTQSKINETNEPNYQDGLQREENKDNIQELQMTQSNVVKTRNDMSQSTQLQNRHAQQQENSLNQMDKNGKSSNEIQVRKNLQILPNKHLSSQSYQQLIQIQQAIQESSVTQVAKMQETHREKDSQIEISQKPQIFTNQQKLTNEQSPKVQSTKKLEKNRPKLVESSPQLQKDPNVEYELPLTLKEVFFGGEIIENLNINVLDSDGIVRKKSISFRIPVQPGILPDKRYIFPNAHHQSIGRIPADITFIFSDMKHPYFRRQGSNVLYTALITQDEAKNGVQLKVPTLEGRLKKISLNGPIKHGTVKNYKNRGLPNFSNPQERGLFIVRFETVDDVFKDPSIEKLIKITLEEILHGCRKEIKYNHTFFDLDRHEQTIEKIIPIDITPGTETGGVFYYSRLGDTREGRIPADFEITILEKKHPNFTRKGNDIEYKAKVLQRDLARGYMSIPTLEGPIDIQIRRDVATNPIQRVHGYGLPDCTGNRGDLVVHFKIVDAGTVQDNSIKTLQEDMPDEIIYNLPLTLEEIITGTTKRVSLDDQYGNKTGRVIFINVKAGSVAGTMIRCDVKDYQKLTIITEERPHQYFKRMGLDIHYEAHISLKEALCGGKVQIPKLKKIFNMQLEPVVNPNKQRTILNRGIPDNNNLQQSGNLIVFWKIRFPSILPKESKSQLTKILSPIFEQYPNNRDKIKILHCETQQIQPPKQSNQLNRNPPIEHAIILSLEEILLGTSSPYQIARILIDSNGNKKIDLKVLNVMLCPGQMETIFPKEGNHHPNMSPSDVIFRVIDAPHQIFKRHNRVDIECIAVITLQEALCGFILQVPTLEKKIIELSFGLDDESVIALEEIHTIPGLGLPYLNDPNKRGNLIVRFEIIFPDELSKEQKNKIEKILKV